MPRTNEANWEQRRRENEVAGMVDMPAGKLDRLSDKQKAFYSSMRGAFRNALKITLAQLEDRIARAYEGSVTGVADAWSARARGGADMLMSYYDSLKPDIVMLMRIDSPQMLIMCRMAGMLEEKQ